jgi:hypothetical protein
MLVLNMDKVQNYEHYVKFGFKGYIAENFVAQELRAAGIREISPACLERWSE